jgi:uncharacterized protein YbcI
MLDKLILTSLPLLSGCTFLPLAKDTPFQIKAVIEGEIKGHKIHCEKTIDLADGKWGVMCNVGNDMDVKYRVRPMSDELTQVEFVVGKAKEGREKLIATPTLLVKKAQSARTVSTTNTSSITVLAERVR